MTKTNNSIFSGVCLILGFFDGIHKGHQSVITQAVEYAKKMQTQAVLLTFGSSPAEYFGKKSKHIYSRDQNYKLITDLGVNKIIVADFSQIVNIKAEAFLRNYLIERFHPISITTGFNYTFGSQRCGNSEFLSKYQKKYDYKYFCIPACTSDQQIISSTFIKSLLKQGKTEEAEKYLGRHFSLTSKVIYGNQIGQQINFPTANMEYPPETVKLPYGVYAVKTLGRNAILNWGKKPTLGKNKEVLEVHIPDFSGNLYGQELTIDVVKKIREEQKFANLNELKEQIAKDIKCLE